MCVHLLLYGVSDTFCSLSLYYKMTLPISFLGILYSFFFFLYSFSLFFSSFFFSLLYFISLFSVGMSHSPLHFLFPCIWKHFPLLHFFLFIRLFFPDIFSLLYFSSLFFHFSFFLFLPHFASGSDVSQYECRSTQTNQILPLSSSFPLVFHWPNRKSLGREVANRLLIVHSPPCFINIVSVQYIFSVTHSS